MVSKPHGGPDDAPEAPSFTPIDEKGRQIIVLLGQMGIYCGALETTPCTKLKSLSIKLVNIPQAGTVGHLADDQDGIPKDYIMLEIIDHLDPKIPLKYSFLNNMSLGKKPYFNTVNLETPKRYRIAQPQQYMGVLDRAIDELKNRKSTNERVQEIL